MNEYWNWVWSGVVGLAVGAVFFGGLWWTINLGVHSKNPGLLFIVSLVARTGLTLLAFYFVSDGDWKRMVACLFGFILARLALQRMVWPKRDLPLTAENSQAHPKEAGHAA